MRYAGMANLTRYPACVLLTLIGQSRVMRMSDETARKFDEWARNGKAEDMQRGHAKSVATMLRSARFSKKFTFLDVGCGNGWTVRRVAAQNPGCVRSVGIDKSSGMINRAKTDPGNTGIEEYFCADVERWAYRGPRFDYVFAMESIYYADSVRLALARIHMLLKPGGVFLCGTDFYAENVGTRRWSAAMGITMHLYTKKEWRRLFADAGFDTRLRHIRDPAAREAWRRKAGTLFVTGIKNPQSAAVPQTGRPHMSKSAGS